MHDYVVDVSFLGHPINKRQHGRALVDAGATVLVYVFIYDYRSKLVGTV
nr:hypothetical protein [Acidithrix ferrooxidans]